MPTRFRIETERKRSSCCSLAANTVRLTAAATALVVTALQIIVLSQPALAVDSGKVTAHSESSTSAASPAQDNSQDRALLDAMSKELNRSMTSLRSAGEAPLYFLSYSLYDTESVSVQADYGALYAHDNNSHNRSLDIDLRVGNAKVDSSHKLRDASFSSFDMGSSSGSPFPIENDEAAVRTALWLRTDAAFKSAQKKYRKVVTNKGVKVEEDDTSDDFSIEKPHSQIVSTSAFNVNREAWEQRVRKLSAIYKQYPAVQDSNIAFSASKTRQYLVNSEGSNIVDERIQYRIFSTVTATASDGMKVWLFDGVETRAQEELPDDAALEKMIRKLAEDLTNLKSAQRAEPYAGPAILRAKAAGVFFHEIFGHRIEGHRQKDETEGRTFTKKVGHSIMPEFISVYDDPTLQKFGSKSLNGYYQFDDEGVPAEKVILVDHGILRNFLMARSPIKGFSRSNGHGRSSSGHAVVARQGNLIVDSAKRVPLSQLREMLVTEALKQGKPYGLLFDEIAGGFTMTQTFMPQSFKLLPLRVWKVYTDGRPDELLRGVDLVGTPLSSLERIMAAADDDDTFNGTCGAESGWVPVSATSPSLLVGNIEVELQSKAQEKPPLLPSPLSGKLEIDK